MIRLTVSMQIEQHKSLAFMISAWNSSLVELRSPSFAFVDQLGLSSFEESSHRPPKASGPGAEIDREVMIMDRSWTYYLYNIWNLAKIYIFFCTCIAVDI